MITIFSNNSSRSRDSIEEECIGSSGDEYIKCIEENSYHKNDILTVPPRTVHNDSIRVKSAYINVFDRFAQSLEIESGMLTNDVFTTLTVHLNTNLSYDLAFIDSRMLFYSYRVDTYPITRVKLDKDPGGTLQVYLKVLCIEGYFVTFDGTP